MLMVQALARASPHEYVSISPHVVIVDLHVSTGPLCAVNALLARKNYPYIPRSSYRSSHPRVGQDPTS